MNYLSIDLWNKRCWIAYTNMWIIFMTESIARTSLISQLKKIIKEKDISKIIIWMPFDLYGKDKTQLERTKKFIWKLKEIFINNEIIEIDERFTTFEAINTLKQSWEKDIFSKKDSMSAFLILETYLNKIKNS